MKKIILALMLSLLLAGCGSEMPNLSMDSFISAYESEGIEVDTAEKPAFGMIGATDGVIFYNGSDPVKIYEYDSKEALSNAESDFPMIKDFDKNGLFLLETSNDEAREIFSKVE